MYYYEATVTDEGLCRLGFSTSEASLDLGTCKFGYGYGVIFQSDRLTLVYETGGGGQILPDKLTLFQSGDRLRQPH